MAGPRVTRDQAAQALDATWHLPDGPRTFGARQRVAQWLDGGGPVTPHLRADVAWLEHKAQPANGR